MTFLKFTLTPKILATLVALVSLLFGGTRLTVNATQKSMPEISRGSMIEGNSLKSSTSPREETKENLNAQVHENEKEDTSFKGTVDQISQNLIVVSGMSFTINQETKIEGNIMVGEQVDVKFLPTSTGSQTALKIEVEESKIGAEDENETSLSNPSTDDKTQLEEQSTENSSAISNENSSSANDENKSISNNANTDDRSERGMNSNRDGGGDNEHDNHN